MAAVHRPGQTTVHWQPAGEQLAECGRPGPWQQADPPHVKHCPDCDMILRLRANRPQGRKWSGL